MKKRKVGRPKGVKNGESKVQRIKDMNSNHYYYMKGYRDATKDILKAQAEAGEC